MAIGKSSINPSKIDPFDLNSKKAYDAAERGSYYKDEYGVKDETLYVEEHKIKEEEYHYMSFDFRYSGKANVYLEWDDSSDLDLYIFDREGLLLEKDSSVSHKTTKKGNRFILCHSIDINKYTDYLICIRGYKVSGSYANYTLKVKIYDNINDYNDMLVATGLDKEGVDNLTSSYKFYRYGHNRGILEYGDRGTDVAHLQRMLKKLDCYHDKLDGLFYRNTKTAVKNMQRDWSILVDGVVGEQTSDILEEAVYWKRKGTSAAEHALISEAISAGGLAKILSEYNIDVSGTALGASRSWEYGPIFAGALKVTYKVKLDASPGKDMVKITCDDSTPVTVINLNNFPTLQVSDHDAKMSVDMIKSIILRLENEEGAEVYINGNFPKLTINVQGRLTWNGPNIVIGASKVIKSTIAGDVFKQKIYEEIILEPQLSQHKIASFSFKTVGSEAIK
ncbi:peptidoglycan-binding domain-containing protein [Paramaledivibacter caminithermalis]|uniref:Putative peptidoglycan binding domain-containing protein n=1 Tax=Paramaledivibacter caminithermalis (strain DSM 15212 / CIP 107654 / DViRD3) TaxID=1121301 RepID=A0A1M6TZ83_PARC5|nr:peptidoglycan-binding domain-containing protein [Paramaledivibacter caminithermalis]SHK62200.1 Putative peptidoglycan binding domain-containing protein [Paramaledivibacter caminithermalis DSM 15212]